MANPPWYLHEVARALGTNDVSWVYHDQKRYAVDGSRVTTRKGLEKVFADGAARGLRGSPGDLMRFLTGSPEAKAEISLPEPQTITAAPVDVQKGSASQNPVHSQQIAAMAECLAQVLAIVAAQQREIEELRASATLAGVHAAVGAQASAHLQSALTASARVLNDRSGEIEVRSVVQKGAMSVRRAKLSERRETADNSSESSRDSKVDVRAEIKGVASALAGGKLGVRVDTSVAEGRAASHSNQGRTEESEAFEGTFEISYDGVRIKVGS